MNTYKSVIYPLSTSRSPDHLFLATSFVRRLAITVVGSTLALAVVNSAGTAAWATRPKAAVMKFRGRGAKKARRHVLRALAGSGFTTIGGKPVLRACRAVKTRFRPGPGLKKAAARIGVSVLVSGRVRRRRLRVVVIDGGTGEVIQKSRVRWPRRPSEKNIERLRRIVSTAALAVSGLNQVNNSSAASPAANGSGEGREAGGESGSDIDLPPDAESPLQGSSAKGASTGDAAAKGAASNAGSGTDRASHPSRKFGVEVSTGLWIRDFSIDNPSPNRIHGEYPSVSAFAVGGALEIYPVAYFSRGFMRNIWVKVRFKSVVGLSSDARDVIGEGPGNDSLSTSMWELAADLGYAVPLFDAETGPILDFGAGFGMFNFSIADGDSGASPIADAGYRFARFSVGVRYPLFRALGLSNTTRDWRNFGLRGGGAYRLMVDLGDIETDPLLGYGSGSANGFDGSVALTWDYGPVNASVAYSLTYYSLTFDEDIATRIADGKLAGNGATDLLQSVMLSVGYGF